MARSSSLPLPSAALIPAFALALALLVFGCVHSPASAPAQSGSSPNSSLILVTSFTPVQQFVSAVAGNDAQITLLIPPGAEPHDFEPTPSDAKALSNARAFFYISDDMEPWAKGLAQSANSSITLAPLSSAVSLHSNPVANLSNFEGNGLSSDPHIWLSPRLAQQEVAYIRDTLTRADPAHAPDYQKNAAAYIARLQALDSQYGAGLSSCNSRTLITSHAAFGYLADDYNLTQVPIAGISPDAEPSPARLISVIQAARAANATAVFTEPGVSPKLAQAVASELDIPTLPFNPVEIISPADQAAGKDYVSLMQDNLAALRQGLGCE